MCIVGDERKSVRKWYILQNCRLRCAGDCIVRDSREASLSTLASIHIIRTIKAHTHQRSLYYSSALLSLRSITYV
ncbi:hypothetical protein PAXRUDRAFT_194784 [Paxillus rubicundulus Ve08.2h10]|uniref:Uncharacterized protein n=1 Tax=Paxillus rubicundulus Ve08.2h10 TaxID=930991 RepID=A0A0D0DB66_9AGAM|nr:hypothetical protein PAXRUDRAFT_194784 [Paxillus rubicundulus Ve08.2h10]